VEELPVYWIASRWVSPIEKSTLVEELIDPRSWANPNTGQLLEIAL
jgi:hypothetical protein